MDVEGVGGEAVLIVRDLFAVGVKNPDGDADVDDTVARVEDEGALADLAGAEI